ncbi:YciI family protein [Geomicrobium sp. JCM 19039]|uniref:YciI family protein n=1 Tax=Geomicrobium sp. JCM 19039 TaxID=1460636 RepID=UPI00045F39C3|nr:YciI family protein [Geomicrobium sp. JCM 19039]GAK12184.1 hypothetical protein JCM19039_1926 [Geomicrobium sp. JCM 19039]
MDLSTFIVWIERKPSFSGDTIAGHRDFISQLKENGLLVFAGPFSDQTGGAYVIKAASLESVKSLIGNDPMNNEDCIYEVKEWNYSS